MQLDETCIPWLMGAALFTLWLAAVWLIQRSHPLSGIRRVLVTVLIAVLLAMAYAGVVHFLLGHYMTSLSADSMPNMAHILLIGVGGYTALLYVFAVPVFALLVIAALLLDLAWRIFKRVRSAKRNT